MSSCLECSICLASPKDPVVTICGHLFCWPCLYRCIQPRSPQFSSPIGQCPICKHQVLPDSSFVTPILGHYAEGDANPTVPPRPHAQNRTEVIGWNRLSTGELEHVHIIKDPGGGHFTYRIRTKELERWHTIMDSGGQCRTVHIKFSSPKPGAL